MKPCIIFALLLVVTTAAVAQKPLSEGAKKKLDAELLRSFTQPETKVWALPSQDTLKVESYRKLLEAQRWRNGGLIRSTYSHTTERGKVYTLSPDNMPCLVPDMKAVAAMPNAGGVILDDRMNAIPRQRIIPREGGANKK